MSKSYEQVLQELDSKIPREEVSTRDAGQGRSLDYVSGYYVISQLNRILGPSNWAYTSEISKLFEGTIKDRYGKDVHTVHYSAKVRLVVKFPNEVTTEFGDYGYGDGTDKVNPGKAHELAIKEAVTDGLKRCAKNLGNRLGLALYSKEQENVEETPVQKQQEEAKPAAVAVSKPKVNRESVNKLIYAKSSVVISKGLKTKDELLNMMQNSFGTTDKEKLTDDQASALLAKLEEILK